MQCTPLPGRYNLNKIDVTKTKSVVESGLVSCYILGALGISPRLNYQPLNNHALLYKNTKLSILYQHVESPSVGEAKVRVDKPDTGNHFSKDNIVHPSDMGAKNQEGDKNTLVNAQPINTSALLATPAIEDQGSDYEEWEDWEEQYYHNSSQARWVIDEAVTAGRYTKAEGKGDSCRDVNIMKVERDMAFWLRTRAEE